MDTTTVMIVIDALGWEIAERHGFSPRGLDGRRRLRTVFGFSQAALTSILTGLPPQVHGLWMMYCFADADSPFGWLRLLPTAASTERRWMRMLLALYIERVMRVRSYYSLYSIPKEILAHLDIPARRNLFAPGGVDGGWTLIDEIDRLDTLRFVRDHRTEERRAFSELKRALGRKEAGFYLLYTAGLDADLHRYGTAHDRIAEHLRWYAGEIEDLSRNDAIRCFVLGDHGMIDVTGAVDMVSEIERAGRASGLGIPDDYIPFYDSTMARFHTRSDRAREVLGNVLDGFRGGGLLDEGEFASLGIDFPLREYGDLVFLAAPGTVVLPSYMGAGTVRGMHGYHPAAAGMDSVLLANVEIPPAVEDITDVAGAVLPGFGGRGAV